MRAAPFISFIFLCNFGYILNTIHDGDSDTFFLRYVQAFM